MLRTMMKSKIHRAIVTETNLDYEGSLLIDTDLLKAADILPNEQIHVWDVTSGNRLVTYALAGEPGSGVIQVNGGGAHLIKKGDIIIIATFTEMKTKAAKKFQPTIIFVNEKNQPQTDPFMKTEDFAASDDAQPAAESVVSPAKTRGRKKA
ncbi:aspartate 1-decarboxylase [Limnoglobus roseus]|uniref:Aspartate 1-decarboxylase n=1 Tax=Limnoglobus roseus TaxID=2598579 RepID=A0A5C1ANS6_9BACT|nr:aspartate 1-decarboxylase [Limnoglobus roseus]QEL19783.1 aspartate 1-decarboxylase [Limnoglobus roseus]